MRMSITFGNWVTTYLVKIALTPFFTRRMRTKN